MKKIMNIIGLSLISLPLLGIFGATYESHVSSQQESELRALESSQVPIAQESVAQRGNRTIERNNPAQMPERGETSLSEYNLQPSSKISHPGKPWIPTTSRTYTQQKQ